MEGFDPASFRDPEGRVFEHRGRIFRALLGPQARQRMEAMTADGTLPALIADGLVVDSRLMPAGEAGLDESAAGPVVMEHARVPVLTYPYEWPFDMLKGAALLTLDLLRRCLTRGYILKDGTPYNVALIDGRLRFIDVLSIDAYTPGQPWDGYAQFCREFLNPLLLTALTGVAFQPWLRGRLDGLRPAELVRLLRLRDRLRPGVLKHVVLQARLEKSFAASGAEIRRSFAEARIGKEMIAANARSLARLIGGLEDPEEGSQWAGYAAIHSYSPEEEAAKRAFVARALERAGCRRVVDLGTNTGDYALIAARTAERVIAADADPACVNRVFQRMGREPDGGKLVPMVVDVTNPSPAQGWAGTERKSLFERLDSDGFLALALVHHVCIGANVPLAAFAALLARLGRAGVVEWVAKEDAMVRRLLRNRVDVFPDYAWPAFERALARHFRIVETRESHGGARRLCFVEAAGEG